VIRFAMPALIELDVLMDRCFRGLAERGRVVVAVHETFADERADAHGLCRLEDRVRVPNGAHVENRSGAAGQELSNSQPRGGIEAFLVMRAFEGPDPLLQPVEQLKVVGEVAKKSLAEVHVSLHEAGEYDLAA